MTTPLVHISLQPLGKTITVERGTSLRNVLHAYGVEFPCGGRGRCSGCRIKQIGGSLPVTTDQTDALTSAELADGWRLACRYTADSDLVLEIGQWESVILADHSHFEFTPRAGLGIAVDLGTTTIVAQLLDLQSGQVLAVRTAVNPQTIHGSDVMTRIQLAVDGGQHAQLVTELRHGLGTMLAKLVAAARLDAPQVTTVVIAGNTVMHHLFCGIDVTPLSRAPFETAEGGPRCFRARELVWKLAGDPTVRFLPCLGGFVGSDILCGILATKMQQSATPLMLVDLGTNGEIVIGNRERMLCASTAAGPAFEGGRIVMGMRATTGAISEVTIEAGTLRCRVIGDVAPRGLCGSGLVDAVAAGLDLGLIHQSGRLANGGRALELAPPVTLVQNDIRQLQLAKAAIAAGIHILQARFGDTTDITPPLYLAGAFGNYVNRASARRIGLISAPDEQIEPAGNTALLGAKMALFANDPEDDDFHALRARIEHVPLAADPDFHERYIDGVAFPA
ncbi:MAG: ASKHA domain-containing protein [Candidatus Binatia bacterium]